MNKSRENKLNERPMGQSFVNTYRKKLPYDGCFLDVSYLLVKRQMTTDKRIFQALFMQWLSEKRIYASLYKEDSQKKSKIAYVFFVPIHEQKPIKHKQYLNFILFADANKDLEHFFKPDARIEKETKLVNIINNNEFWESFNHHIQTEFWNRMEHIDTDQAIKENTYDALFFEVLPRTMEIYINNNVDIDSVNVNEESFQSTLRKTIIEQIDISMSNVEELIKHSIDYVLTLTWPEIIGLLMKDSKDTLIKKGYLNPHEQLKEDVLTKKGKDLERHIYGLINYMEQFGTLQSEYRLEKDPWDNYLIWASLFGLEEELFEQMLKIDAEFAQRTSFPANYPKALYNYAEVIIKSTS